MTNTKTVKFIWKIILPLHCSERQQQNDLLETLVQGHLILLVSYHRETKAPTASVPCLFISLASHRGFFVSRNASEKQTAFAVGT